MENEKIAIGDSFNVNTVPNKETKEAVICFVNLGNRIRKEVKADGFQLSDVSAPMLEDLSALKRAFDGYDKIPTESKDNPMTLIQLLAEIAKKVFKIN